MSLDKRAVHDGSDPSCKPTRASNDGAGPANFTEAGMNSTERGRSIGSAAIFAFADCELDRGRRQLRFRSRAIHIEPQVFDLLETLLVNRDRFVSKEELFASVWKGRMVSDATLYSRLSAARRAIGDNGEDRKLIVTVPRRGFRFAGEARELPGATFGAVERPTAYTPSRSLDQSVGFCTTPDGVRLAVAAMGEGHAVVKASVWLSHISHDLDNPMWSGLYPRLAQGRRLIRYDGRGTGLSDLGVADISFERLVADLETVIDSLDVEKVSLVGMSMGAAVAIAYAARTPERVHKIVLHGAFAMGRRRRNSASDLERADLLLALVSQGWGKPDAAFMKAFSCIYFPQAGDEWLRWFAELQQQNASPETATRIRAVCDDIDVVELLASVRAPVLVTHSKNDHVVPVEQGRLVASLLPNARFLPLDSSNHMILHDEPEGPRLAALIDEFLGIGPT
jgi:pimeloyl-ACP methyl ester carboxylesterase/DNA-binding winged helix-turn-helix (wHTH) protein